METPMKRQLNLLVVSAACAAVVACAGSGSDSMLPADTILTNAKIVTVDANSTIAQAVAIKDGKFLRVGAPADVLRHRGPDTKVIDLNGQTGDPRVNIQNDKGKAKAYQVRQVLMAIDKLESKS